MNEDNNLPNPSLGNGSDPVRKIIWLFAAFFPGVAGIICLNIKNPGSWLFPALLILNLVFSVASSVGLVKGMKNEGSQFALGFFLTGFFFVLNAFIVLFVGCSGMGRIAP